MPAFAAQEEPLTVRVGVYESNGLVALDENEQLTGYGASFMETLARYANVCYEYVHLTWSDCMAGLLNGTIDIVADARKNTEREALYDFSVQCIGQIQGALFVPKDMPNIYFNDYQAFGALTVGFEKGVMNKALYEQYAALHGFTAKTVEYPAVSDLRAALKKGEIDAFGCDAHVYTDDLKVVAIYNTDPNYIMGPKNSPIMRRLNLAIEQIYAENPGMIAEQSLYLAQRQIYGDILLTRAETEYLEQNPVLRVAVYDDRKPASWRDPQTGEFHGIAIELMDRLAQITGLRFEYVGIQREGYSVNALLNEDIDIAMPVIGAAYYNGSIPVRITDPLYTLSVALAYNNKRRLDQNGDIVVALTGSNTGIKAMLSQRYPNMHFATFDTVQECIGALQVGQVDAYANALYELEYCLKNPHNENLSIAYSYSCPIEYCLAVREDAQNELVSILNNGIAMIQDAQAEQIIRNNSTFVQYEASLADTLYQNRHILIGAGIIILFILIAWIGYCHIQKRVMTQIRRKEVESRMAAEEARRANAAKTEFLTRMSHDMRTPLNGILGCAALAKDESDLLQINKGMCRIENEGQYLLGLINDMLDMSKIESGQLALNLQPVDSTKVIEDTLRLVESYTTPNQINVDVRLHELQQGMVLMDAPRVKQIMVNVIANAAKFSHKGGTVELYGECYEVQPNKVRDKFVIRDHGVGIRAAFLPHVFEPFSQESHTTDDGRLDGSGLGLSIVKNLVDMMNGRIYIASELGVGTTVTIYLDFARCPDPPKEAQEALPALSGIRVLMCEDNEINTVVAKAYLDKAGCTVECATDGRMGVDMFCASQEGYYDVILMDIRMPVMDGVEATKAIRALERADAKAIPILAVTANTFPEDVKEYLLAGMNDCLAKPVTMQLLLETIHRHLGA